MTPLERPENPVSPRAEEAPHRVESEPEARLDRDPQPPEKKKRRPPKSARSSRALTREVDRPARSVTPEQKLLLLDAVVYRIFRTFVQALELSSLEREDKYSSSGVVMLKTRRVFKPL